jgi:hypothetical protein
MIRRLARALSLLTERGSAKRPEHHTQTPFSPVKIESQLKRSRNFLYS